MGSIFDITGGDKRVILAYLSGDDGETLELIKIDATRAVQHSLKAKATKHEVEDGANISDHVIKGDRMVSLDCVVSDDPITVAGAVVGNLAGIAGSLVDGLGGAVVTGAVSKLGSQLIINGDKHSKDAFDLLDIAYENKIPFIIITAKKTYTNMIMESLDMPENIRTVRSLEFKATFKEIRIIESEVVDIPVSASSAEGSVESVKGGKKPSVAPDTQTATSGSTLLFKLQEAVQ